MRILHVIDSLNIGGAERLIVDIVPLQNQAGYISDVVLLDGKNTYLLEELKKRCDCEIYSLGNSFYNLLYILKLIPIIKKYDIIHVHLFPAQYFVILAKLISFSKVKVVYTEHNTSNKRLKYIVTKYFDRWIYSFFTKITCITESVYKVVLKELNVDRKKLLIIENGINVSIVQKSKKYNKSVFGFNEDDIVIIMVASFRKQKDQDTVVRALQLLESKYKVVFVGEGERQIEVLTLANSLNVQNRINFIGIRSDVFSLIKTADIAVLSSHWEGFGLVAVEAMACGIPLIASNVEGLSSVVEGGGVLFEKGNYLDLYNSIIKFENENYYNSIAKEGILRSEQFDIKFMNEKFINLYNNILK